MGGDGRPGACEARTRLGPPGVDVEEFSPREPDAARRGLEALVARLRRRRAAGDDRALLRPRPAPRPPRRWPRSSPTDRLVVFVGKLIASKGVDLLLAAWPLVLAARARGAARDRRLRRRSARGSRSWRRDLAAGDLDAARATRGENGLRAAVPARVPRRARRGRLRAARPADRVVWTGRLDHAELADLLPAAEAMVVPSTFPEAFGMVAAEAAACGALPVVARHSGLGEVAETLAEAVPEAARPLAVLRASARAR